jgi:hypothetical protein
MVARRFMPPGAQSISFREASDAEPSLA